MNPSIRPFFHRRERSRVASQPRPSKRLSSPATCKARRKPPRPHAADQRFVGWKFDGKFLSRDMPADVTVIDETQTVDALFRRAGDITGDQAINLNDFALFAVCFGKSWGDNIESTCSNEALASADLDRNGVIDLRDFATFAVHFGT